MPAEHYIDQSAYSLTSKSSPSKSISETQFCKKKVVSFSIKYHVLYFADMNYETLINLRKFSKTRKTNKYVQLCILPRKQSLSAAKCDTLCLQRNCVDIFLFLDYSAIN